MTRAALLACLLIVSPTAVGAAAQDGLPLHLAVAGYIVLQGADIATTSTLIATNPQAREVNPVLAPFVSSPVKFAVVKMSVATASSWLLLAEHAKHPRLALVSALAADGLYVLVVHHNARLIR